MVRRRGRGPAKRGRRPYEMIGVVLCSIFVCSVFFFLVAMWCLYETILQHVCQLSQSERTSRSLGKAGFFGLESDAQASHIVTFCFSGTMWFSGPESDAQASDIMTLEKNPMRRHCIA